MDLNRCYLVQDRETCAFIGREPDGEMEFVSYVNRAHRFDCVEEAVLNGLAMCSEGYVVFFCYVEPGDAVIEYPQ